MLARRMLGQRLIVTVLLAMAAGAVPVLGQAAPQGAVDPMLARIREEGMQRSQVMETLSYLTNVIGPRLTGSPGAKKANEWTRDQLTKFGMSDAHLESWAFGGRGWQVMSFKIQVIEPEQISIIAYPKAWSMGLEKPVVANVVLLDARTEEDLQKFKGTLKGAIVLTGGTRAVGPRFAPTAQRLSDADLQRLADAAPGSTSSSAPARGPATGPATRGAGPATRGAAPGGGRGGTPGGGAAATGPAPGGRGGRGGGGPPALARGRIISFLMEEGAVMEMSMTMGNEMGQITGYSSTTLPTTAGTGPGRGGGSVYAPNAPASLPQLSVSVEHFNRLVRIAQAGVPMKIDVDLQVKFTTDDLNAYNTIAEIPGGDLKEEVVMVGAHLDSFHMGTGATDNGTGVAECMEAMRILKALNIQPRRTIRIGLWTGEEQGLLGSRAYARQHFGGAPGGRGRRGGGGGGGAATEPASMPATAPAGFLPAHSKFSVYFNSDEGGGRFRGVFVGNNLAAAESLRRWLDPVKDLGASTVSMARSSGSDHQSFEGVGLPAINFIPDPIDYWVGTWHTSQDLYEHVVPEDLKVSATVMATCVYQAAMAPEKMPRGTGQ